MSRVSYYKCDGCGKPTGEKPHITLFVGGGAGSGIALPPGHPRGSDDGWHTAHGFSGLYHFHSGKCAAIFLDRMFAKATDKKA